MKDEGGVSKCGRRSLPYMRSLQVTQHIIKGKCNQESSRASSDSLIRCMSQTQFADATGPRTEHGCVKETMGVVGDVFITDNWLKLSGIDLLSFVPSLQYIKGRTAM